MKEELRFLVNFLEKSAKEQKKYHHAEILLGAQGNEPVTMKVEPRRPPGQEPPKRPPKKPGR